MGMCNTHDLRVISHIAHVIGTEHWPSRFPSEKSIGDRSPVFVPEERISIRASNWKVLALQPFWVTSPVTLCFIKIWDEVQPIVKFPLPSNESMIFEASTAECWKGLLDSSRSNECKSTYC
tara:strand:+ start:435 stop:797 length:363 start_codon:yes stop_codon:yes gene_type:complete